MSKPTVPTVYVAALYDDDHLEVIGTYSTLKAAEMAAALTAMMEYSHFLIDYDGVLDLFHPEFNPEFILDEVNLTGNETGFIMNVFTCPVQDKAFLMAHDFDLPESS